MEEIVLEYRLTNRERSREPRGKSFWCFGCDRNQISAGQRCSVCGHVEGHRSKAGKLTPIK